MYCKEHQTQRISLPQEGEDDVLSFTAIKYQHKIPYTCYADFESLLVPINSASPSTANSFTEKKTLHVACRYAFIIIGPDGKPWKKIQLYHSENAIEHFLDTLIKEKEKLVKKLKYVKPMRLTDAEEKAFVEAEIPAVCKKPLGKSRVRDHCHITGKYRNA